MGGDEVVVMVEEVGSTGHTVGASAARASKSFATKLQYVTDRLRPREDI